MTSLQESVVKAMDGTNASLFPYLPYILQDLWEIGTDPATVAELVEQHIGKHKSFKVLDLGCGKGAVSVYLARHFPCHCLGVDALEEFIKFARLKAAEYQVADRCSFVTGDMRNMIPLFHGFDLIVLGAIGPVLGNYTQTLSQLLPCLSEQGMFVVDDGYIPDHTDFSHATAIKYSDMLHQIDQAGMQIVTQIPFDSLKVKESDDFIMNHLTQRCRELMELYPHQWKLFEDYIADQERESQINAEKLVCTTMLIGRK